MKIISEKITLDTKGDCDIIDITPKISSLLKNYGLKTGIVNVFIPGATGALTTIEYEPGLLEDTKKMFRDLVSETCRYSHDEGNPDGNAPSHLRASLVGPSLTVPFGNGILETGTWQQIVFIDFDNRPRSRKLIVKIIGE